MTNASVETDLRRRQCEQVYNDSVSVDEEPKLGGAWRPSNCTSQYRIAIVVPYRNRQQHLPIFLRHMHPFLQRQMLDYTIYVVEQVRLRFTTSHLRILTI